MRHPPASRSSSSVSATNRIRASVPERPSSAGAAALFGYDGFEFVRPIPTLQRLAITRQKERRFIPLIVPNDAANHAHSFCSRHLGLYPLPYTKRRRQDSPEQFRLAPNLVLTVTKHKIPL